MADVQGFIQQYGPVAAAVSQRIGVAPDVLLGQWGLETGWGKSVIPGTNNLGNIKGPGVAAKDNQTGSVDQYRAYSSPLDFGNDFVNLISNNYKNAIGKGADAAGYAGALKAGGYAEDPKYVSKLAGAVDMVRKFGDTIASALSGTANASELTPAQMGAAPVISATGQRLNGAPAAAAPAQPGPTQAAPTGDPLLDMAHGVLGGTAKPATQGPTAATSSQPKPVSDDPLMAMASSVMAAKDQPAKAAAQQQPVQKSAAPAASATPTNLLGAAVEPLLTAATGAIATPAGWATRLGAALTGSSFDQAKAAGAKVQDALTYHPMTAGGQQANADIGRVAGNALSAIANTAPVKALMDAYQQNFVQGQSPLMATVNDMVPSVTAAAIAPSLAGRATNLVKAIGRPDMPVPTPGSIELANRGVGPVPQGLPAAQMERLPVAPASNDLAFIQRPGDIRVGQPMEAAPGQGLAAAPVANDAVGLNRIASNDATGGRPNLPQAPTPQAVGRGAPANDSGAPPAAAPASVPVEIPRFDAEAPSTVKSSLAPAQQQQNLDLMREIGLDSIRPSAISGDKFSAGQEYQLAKTDTPQGEVLRAQFDKERAAIQNYAQQILQDTGARGASPEEVGQIIRQPLRDLNAYYDNAVSGIYQAADQRAAGIAGIDADAFKTLLDTKSNFAGKAENGSLGRGINAYLREQGLRNPDGTFNPMTAQQAEGVRQYINSQWSPQNSGLIGKIKESLDMDVAKTAGDDVYAQARALHAERKNLLDNPNGISSLLNEQGPNGINQAIPDEKVGQKLTSMPVGQLRHIVDTLNNAPAELQPVAQQALSEMRGVFADLVRNAGQGAEWNAAKVTKTLNDQRSRMGLLFDDGQMSQFRTLNNAGHVLQKPTAYPGAAAQGHNLLQRAVIWSAPAATTGAASALFGPWGAAVAAPAGAALTRKATQFVNQRAANKLLESFSKPQVDWQK